MSHAADKSVYVMTKTGFRLSGTVILRRSSVSSSSMRVFANCIGLIVAYEVCSLKAVISSKYIDIKIINWGFYHRATENTAFFAPLCDSVVKILLYRFNLNNL